MPEVRIEKGITLDLLSNTEPSISSTNDMPVIETKPDSVNEAPAAPASEEVATTTDTEGTTTEDSATPEKPEDSSASAEAKKPAKGVQKRIDELTRQREEERRRALAAEERLDRALKALETRQQPPAESVSEAEELAPVKPSKSDFANPDDYDLAMDSYVEARASWTAKQEVKAALEKANREMMQENIAAENRAIQQRYISRAEKATEKYADYKEVAESPDVTISIPMAHAILHSEQGPDIAYYLGKNPDEAKRISALSPPLQLVELGLIVASIKSPATVQSSTPVKTTVSAAPKPIKPIGSGAGAVDKPLEELTMEEYAERRKAQWATRPGVRH